MAVLMLCVCYPSFHDVSHSEKTNQCFLLEAKMFKDYLIAPLSVKVVSSLTI